MSAWAVYDEASGELKLLLLDDPSLLGLDLAGQGIAQLGSMPDMAAERWDAATRAFVPWAPAPRLTGLQILGLYTPAQHARARRMLLATYPPGHEWAGQLVDPDGLVQRLLDATLALHTPIALDDPLHINGTALLRSVGVIESDAEAARILAGVPPSSML